MNTDLQNAKDARESDKCAETAPLLSVIIVSYRTREMTLRCLRTLFEKTRDVAFDVWVVDNASRDGSCEAIRREFPEVHLIESQRNAGFGAANNCAMKEAQGDWFLLLNSDAFVQDGAVQTLIEYSKLHPRVGVVGPRLLHDDGTLQQSCFGFPDPLYVWLENLRISPLFPAASSRSGLHRWPHDSEREVDWLMGACLLVRREVWEEIGGFDERFWMYFEETDWQRRIAAQGWKIAFVPSAVVTHLGGASGNGVSALVKESFYESLDYYQWKHYGWAGLVSLRLAMTIGCSLRIAFWSLASAVPAQRNHARAKSKLQARLAWRQLTQWKIPLKDKARGDQAIGNQTSPL